MVLPGIQALFGFQLIAVFNQGFGERLSQGEQVLHLVAIAFTVLSMALVMTPAAIHRQAEPRQVSERFIWIGSNLVLSGMVPLALAIGLDAYIVSSLIIRDDAVAVVIATVVVGVFAALWFFLPRREARKHA